VNATAEQDRRFAAIGAAAASALGTTEYRRMRTQDVAALVRLDSGGDRRSAGGTRSVVWLYNEVRSRRVLVALGAAHAWREYLEHADVRVGTDLPAWDRGKAADADAAAPNPLELSDALDGLARAVEHVVRFHQAQGFLVSQVAGGIGDIATSEKSERAREDGAVQWPDSGWGRVAAEAYHGRCAVYADFLAPAIARAARVVVPLPPDRALEQATKLSDLVFRGLIGSGGGATERIAAGFAAYWFERELVFAAGDWARDLYAVERAYAAGAARPGERVTGAGRREIARILLENDTLYVRAAREGGYRWAAQSAALGTSPDALDAAAARRLCDSASRHGLALLRVGDLDGATRAFLESRRLATGPIAADDPDEARSYEARADHNLAEAAIAADEIEPALTACESAFKARSELLLGAGAGADRGAGRPGPGHDAEPSAARRRFLLTAVLRARVLARAGRPVEAVRAADQLLWGSPEEVRRPEPAVRVRATLGEALLEAGHPLEARLHLESSRLALFEEQGESFVGRFELSNRLRLARAALLLEDLDAAEALLPTEATVQWCAEHLSFRAAAQARRLRAECRSAAGHQEEALDLADHAYAELAELCSPMDTLLARLAHTRAVVRYRMGDPVAARALLEATLAQRRTRGARLGPVAAESLMWLARVDTAAGDPAAAAACFAELEAAADASLEATHPLLLEAGLDQAERLVTRNEVPTAVRLVEAVLDDRRLEHGRPAIERGHPLRMRASRLAEALGVRPSRENRSWTDAD
jgi:tetratricopeptide (TPR) repeat protein